MNATSKTPQQNTAEFLNELAGLGFKPGRHADGEADFVGHEGK
jgi:hypothetical protein